MKKATELMIWTLFFSSLVGMGFTAGAFCFLGSAEFIGKLMP